MSAPLPQLTKAQILELYRWRCSHGHRGTVHYNCYLNEVSQPKLGFIDLECSNLKSDFGIILSWCIKPQGKSRILCDVISKEDLQEGLLDRRIIESCIAAMWKFNKLVGHYSSRFDIPFLRGRALYHKLDFPQYGELTHVDTWRLARQLLCIHSNRQDSVHEALFGASSKTRIKSHHWLGALQGSPESLAYILRHNKIDVRELEQNYEALECFARKSNRSL